MDIPGTITNDTYQHWSHFVECPICYTVYDKPMQMGCGHTICSTCIGRLVERVKTSGPTEIKCPECRKPTTVPVNGLPVNYRIQEIVQKVAPLLKDRHLVKHCTQCKKILAEGVYFDCSQCAEKGSKICSTCAIRLHNGHIMVEKKALTSDDVCLMKQKINEASARAFEAIKSIKPQFESINEVIKILLVEKLESLVKIFDFMLNTFDSKIKETSTIDELMVEVEKAERVAETYENGRNINELCTVIGKAIGEYMKPFEKLKQELEFQADIPDIAAAPAPAPPPVRIIYIPPPPLALDSLDHFAQQPAYFPPPRQPQPMPSPPGTTLFGIPVAPPPALPNPNDYLNEWLNATTPRYSVNFCEQPENFLHYHRLPPPLPPPTRNMGPAGSRMTRPYFG
ncbi:hypothetical protein CRE_23331 [Caenorhabditis remanei]|uniref:RING-type domain-containing protein n=1 Tax=Caenorhabditis remanei TaxID=31234 RepID=E3MGW9_CAERE|nr:hypothetical protein CRE_23331 [Caenorhabditis remanei]